MAEREHEPDRDRPFAFLHQLASDIVDGRNVVGVDGVAQAKAVSEERSPHQQRKMAKSESRPKPSGHIESKQNCINPDNFAAHVGGRVVEQTAEAARLGALADGFPFRLSGQVCHRGLSVVVLRSLPFA